MSDPPPQNTTTVDDEGFDSEEPEPAEVLWTSDDALSFEEARRLTSRRGATMVLFAGDTGVGKTTAMVEIWTSLLIAGTVGQFGIAGSSNALAFESRSFRSRAESGDNTTVRTDHDSEGFLHLALTSPRGQIETLFGDYAGEYFRRIREGTEVLDELPWIGRVDRLAVFIDGLHVASPGSVQVAFTRAQRLLWKFRDCEALNPRLRAALVLTKAELIDDERMAQASASIQQLHALTRELDPEARMLHISARPSTGQAPEGLDDLLDWICADNRPAAPYEVALEQPKRAFGRFR